MRILLVDSDSGTAALIELLFRSQGFKVETTDLWEEAFDLAGRYEFDLIVADLQLYDGSALDLLRRLRLSKIGTPFILMGVTADTQTRVRALNLGADDALAKPFHTDELIARVHAVARRSQGLAEPVISVGPIAIHLHRKVVEVNGEPVHLTGREYEMLELLGRRRGATLAKDTFLNHLYGGIDEPETKIVDVFICKLRKKLKDAGAGGYIQTVWGRGYVLRDEAAEGLGLEEAAA